MESYEILEAAGRLIDKPDKWARGAVVQAAPGGGFGFCLMGAISQAAFGRPGLVRDSGGEIIVNPAVAQSDSLSAALAAIHELKLIASERQGGYYAPSIERLNDQAVGQAQVHEIVQLATRRAKAKAGTEIAPPPRIKTTPKVELRAPKVELPAEFTAPPETVAFDVVKSPDVQLLPVF